MHINNENYSFVYSNHVRLGFYSTQGRYARLGLILRLANLMSIKKGPCPECSKFERVSLLTSRLTLELETNVSAFVSTPKTGVLYGDVW